MTKRLEIPGMGQLEVREPSPVERETMARLAGIQNALGQLVGQMDMLIRIEVGNVQKRDINKRIQEADVEIRARIAAEQDPALD